MKKNSQTNEGVQNQDRFVHSQTTEFVGENIINCGCDYSNEHKKVHVHFKIAQNGHQQQF